MLFFYAQQGGLNLTSVVLRFIDLEFRVYYRDIASRFAHWWLRFLHNFSWLINSSVLMTLFSKFSGFDETLADGVEDVLSALVERIKEKDEVKKVGVINANFNIFGKIFYSTRYLQSYVVHSSFSSQAQTAHDKCSQLEKKLAWTPLIMRRDRSRYWRVPMYFCYIRRPIRPPLFLTFLPLFFLLGFW